MSEFFNKLFGIGEKTDLKALLKNRAILLDVRTKTEYKQQAAAKSINIPLDSLSSNFSKLKKEKPIIVVCASGARSSSAVSFLKSKGFSEIYNGKSWLNFK